MKRIFTLLILAGCAAGLVTGISNSSSAQFGSSTPLGLDMSATLLNSTLDNQQFIDMVEASGATSLKLTIPWQDVELSAGLFSWSISPQGTQIDLINLIQKLDQKGIQIVLILDGFPTYLQYESLSEQNIVENYLTSWERYVKASVAQFGEYVDAWQIGQAINLPFDLPDQPIAAAILASPSTYAQRLIVASEAIKSTDKGDVVIMGGINSDTGNCLNQPSAFLNSIHSLDAWDAFDVIGIDLNTYAAPPEGRSMYQTYDSISGVCLTSAEGGFNLAEIIALVDAAGSQYGIKPIWISSLAWQPEDISAIASERGTLPDVVRADFLSRATIMLLGSHHVENVFWKYAAQESQKDMSFGVFSQQVFTNLSASLQGFQGSNNMSDILNGTYQYRTTNKGEINIYVWRGQDGDQFEVYPLSNVNGYNLEAFSLDAGSVNKGEGIALQTDENGNSAFMLSERPLLIRAIPNDLQERVSLYTSGLFSSAGDSIKDSAQDIVDEQKEKASQQVEEWIDEQKDSLLETLKQSLMDWLKEALNLEQLLP
ncbi:MAG TPA: hypothetical protein DCK95_06080 [Anaerolineaceae bacterium]|nr:hypothetical protein [Anaerolineaceae bacterium]